MDQCLPIALGCLPGELVLRGGLLPKPVILTNVKFVGNRPFLLLWKGHPAICKFLTGLSSCKRPLANSSVFESLQSLRNCKFQLLVKQARASQTVADPKEQVDLVDQLGLDAPEVKASPTKLGRPVSALRLSSQLPAFASVSYDHPDGWEPVLLMEAGSKAPAMEATADNLQTLFALVALELAVGTTKRARHGADPASPRPAPRGPAGSREYFVGNRWVKKIRSPDSGGAARPPYAMRFRTLKRKASDEAAAPKFKAKQSRRDGAAKAAAYRALAAEAGDCLSMQ